MKKVRGAVPYILHYPPYSLEKLRSLVLGFVFRPGTASVSLLSVDLWSVGTQFKCKNEDEEANN